MEIISRYEARKAGLGRYFTGDVCIHGHISERYTKSGKCIACSTSSARAKYLEDPQKHRDRGLASYYKDRDKSLARAAAWRSKNSDKFRKHVRDWARERYARSPEYVREIQRKYYKNHREKILQEGRLRYAENSDLYKIYAKIRKARRLINGGSHTMDDRNRQFAIQDGKCAYAGHKFSWCLIVLEGSDAHWDHRTPLSRGGSNDAKNGQYLCRPCNVRKNARNEDDFLRESMNLGIFKCEATSPIDD